MFGTYQRILHDVGVVWWNSATPDNQTVTTTVSGKLSDWPPSTIHHLLMSQLVSFDLYLTKR